MAKADAFYAFSSPFIAVHRRLKQLLAFRSRDEGRKLSNPTVDLFSLLLALRSGGKIIFCQRWMAMDSDKEKNSESLPLWPEQAYSPGNE